MLVNLTMRRDKKQTLVKKTLNMIIRSDTEFSQISVRQRTIFLFSIISHVVIATNVFKEVNKTIWGSKSEDFQVCRGDQRETDRGKYAISEGTQTHTFYSGGCRWRGHFLQMLS